MQRRSIAVIFLFCLAAVVRADAGAGAPTEAAKSGCDYLNQQTASSLYGSPVRAAKGQAAVAGGAMMMCMYADAKAGNAVSLMIMTLPAGMSGTTMMNSVANQQGAKVHTAPVAGLGERAVFVDDGTALMLTALNHGKMLTLGVTGPDSPARRTAMVPVLREILGRVG